MKLPTRKAMVEAAITAGLIAKRHFHAGVTASWKEHDGTPLTIADTEINQQFARWQAKNYPDIAFFGEEGASEIDSEYVLYTDEIDGTIPFKTGVGVFSVVMTLMKGNEPVITVIHDPIGGRTISAQKNLGVVFKRGSGAGVKLDPFSQAEIDHPHVQVVRWPEAPKETYAVEHAMAHSPFMDRRMFTADQSSLAYFGIPLAFNRINATFFAGPSARETVALQLIVDELGGTCTDVNGNRLVYERGVLAENNDFVLPNGHVISANHALHERLLEIVQAQQRV